MPDLYMGGTVLTFPSYIEARAAGFDIEYIGRPLDDSLGEYVSCHGFSQPIYLTLPDQDGCVYGCGNAHEADTDGHPYHGDCGTVYCHGRPGDDRAAQTTVLERTATMANADYALRDALAKMQENGIVGPLVHRIIKRSGVAHGYRSDVWVGLGAANEADEDRTMPEITQLYVTKRALLESIADGSAFLTQIDSSGKDNDNA